MNYYRYRLENLRYLKKQAGNFNYLNKNLLDVHIEKERLQHDYDENNSNFWRKVFKKSLYKNKKKNLEYWMTRNNEIISIFEANPNKENEPDITLKVILNRAINKTMAFCNEEEINNSQSPTYNFGAGLNSSRFYPNMEEIYFNDKPSSTFKHEKKLKQTEQIQQNDKSKIKMGPEKELVR